MLREDLEVLFCFKIGKELEQFKGEIEKMDLDEILARAYQVDTIITIYELLLEMSRQLGKEILETIILYPNLLAFLYEKWMKEEDSHMQELQESLCRSLGEIQNDQAGDKKEDHAA